MTPYEGAWARTLGVEKGFSNHPADVPTRWGITEPVARAHGYDGPMEELPQSLAKVIARKQYWDPLLLDDVAGLSELIAAKLFDTGYNMWISTAAKFLQRSLNVLNRQGTDYPDLEVDGQLGFVTLARLRDFLARRGSEGERVLFRALNDLQGARYIEIAEKNPAKEAFVYGWLRTRVA